MPVRNEQKYFRMPKRPSSTKKGIVSCHRNLRTHLLRVSFYSEAEISRANTFMSIALFD